jgi:hypothetical protein
VTARWQLGRQKGEDLGRRPLLPAPFDPQRDRDDNLQLSLTICAHLLPLLCSRTPHLCGSYSLQNHSAAAVPEPSGA